jgi:hypothetical protein
MAYSSPKHGEKEHHEQVEDVRKIVTIALTYQLMLWIEKDRA